MQEAPAHRLHARPMATPPGRHPERVQGTLPWFGSSSLSAPGSRLTAATRRGKVIPFAQPLPGLGGPFPLDSMPKVTWLYDRHSTDQDLDRVACVIGMAFLYDLPHETMPAVGGWNHMVVWLKGDDPTIRRSWN